MLRYCFISLLLALPFTVFSQPTTAIASIIIDDIGYSTPAVKRIARLDYPITCAILPEAPITQKAADILAASGKELMLHLPMQGRSGEAQEKHVLNSSMNESEFKTVLREHIDRLPHIAGLNNHQGSVLTRQNPPMHWLMEEISLIEDFYFVDSRTTGGSKAMDAAAHHGVLYAERDVFLDHERSEAFVHQQFQEFIRIAKTRGQAVAIGHPYTETLNVLERMLPTLAEEGITIVPASSLVSLPSMTTPQAVSMSQAEALTTEPLQDTVQ